MKQSMWRKDPYGTVIPGTILASQLKPDIEVWIVTFKGGTVVGYVAFPSKEYPGTTSTYNTEDCRSMTTAKKNVFTLLDELDCLKKAQG